MFGATWENRYYMEPALNHLADYSSATIPSELQRAATHAETICMPPALFNEHSKAATTLTAKTDGIGTMPETGIREEGLMQ
jgi:hypothetical protein